jgi:hypothetical protein
MWRIWSMKRRATLRDMKTAPKDCTLIRLRLQAGDEFVGMYSDKFWGWVALHEIACPLIRDAIAFAGWEPIDQADITRMRRESPAPLATMPAEPVAIRPRIVKARRLKPRR